MIENTTDRASIKAISLLALAAGDAGPLIEEQERNGQHQLVHSDRLPTDMSGTRAQFEALGFTFGDPDDADPLFQPATLPAGWTRQGANHAMGSYLLDDLGRRRAQVFYKAAFYDRRANMYLSSVRSYVSGQVYDGADVVTDDTWATPAAVAEAARALAAEAQERLELWRVHRDRQAQDECAGKRDVYLAIAKQHDAKTADTAEVQK